MASLIIPYASFRERLEDNKPAFVITCLLVALLIAISFAVLFMERDPSVLVADLFLVLIVGAFALISYARLQNKIELDERRVTYNVFGIAGASYWKRKMPYKNISSFSVRDGVLALRQRVLTKRFRSLTEEELGRVKAFLLERGVEEAP
ncbi:hypothetical protein JXA12_05240 [Candidatus Woesearchaeota archaeon]|nr:hypothetical protein [Candidatus Woesearchaeota archaeon]